MSGMFDQANVPQSINNRLGYGAHPLTNRWN
jgi:hypothetical protein